MRLRHVLLTLPVAAGLSVLGGEAATAQGVQLFASLFGGNEIGGGDTDGTGNATVTFHGKTKLCFAILVDKIDTPVAAHIHTGIAGVNGDVLVPLTAPSAGNPGTSSGCVTVEDDIYSKLRSNPSDFYVNVHTGKFPNGALRGQLF